MNYLDIYIAIIWTIELIQPVLYNISVENAFQLVIMETIKINSFRRILFEME